MRKVLTGYVGRKQEGRILQKIEYIIFFLIMLKQPAIINMSLNALRDMPKMQQSPSTDKTNDFCAKNSQCKDESVMQDMISFINTVAQERTRVKNKEKKTGKQGGKTVGKTERNEYLSLPLSLCESVGLLLRKYLLFKVQEKSQGPRKSKLPHDRSPQLRALIRVNNQNQAQMEEEDDAGPFRSMAMQRLQRERLILRNQEVERQLVELQERLKEKNSLISKLISKESQLRRKYNDQLGRLTRNKNIYNISANFQRQQEEGEGRNALNITGRGKLTEDANSNSVVFKSLQKPATKTLIKCDSEYMKQARHSKSKNKLHPFRNSKRPIDSAALLKTINKSLPTEIVTRRETECMRLGETMAEGRPTLQLYINQLQATSLAKLGSFDADRRNPATRMRDEQFEALQVHGFYEQQPPIQMEQEAM